MPDKPVETAKETEVQLMNAAVARMETALERIIAQSRAHRSENVTLHGHVSGAEKKLAAAEQQVRQLSETANALQRKVEDARRTGEELEHQARLAAMDQERLRVALQARETEMQGLTDALAQSQHEAERLSIENAAIADERNDARRAVESTEHESASYATLLAQRDAVVAAREEEVNQLAAQVEQGSAQIAELKLMLEQYRSDLAQLGESNGDATPLFSQEERDLMARRIKDIVGKLDRYLA